MTDILKKIESLANAGEFEKAEQLVKKSAIRRAPALAILAAIAMKKGENQKADVFFNQSLREEPDNVIANGNYASLLLAQKNPKRALPYAKKASELAPNVLQFALYLVAAYADADRYADAAAVLSPFVSVDKPDAKALLNYATVLRADLKAEEALKTLERARALYPDDQECQRAAADAYAEIDPVVAREAFKKILEEKPDNISLRWNVSFVELRLRNFAEAWDMYEAGLSEKVGKIGRPLPAQVKCLPLVTDLNSLNPDKWTFFSAEQGIGDQVLFYGALEEGLKHTPKVALVGEDRMIPVLKRAFPGVGVYTYGFASSLARQTDRFNGVFPIGSLMKHFRRDIGSFELNQRVYMFPDEEKTKKLRQTLVSKIGNKTLVGVSWRGGYWDRQKRTKSFDFEVFSKIFKGQNYQFISLQYGDVSEEKKFAKENSLPITFIDGMDFKKDIDGWFALACACDRILSVSTALVHFAGAAGKRVDLLLGDYQAPFIWGTEEGPSIAYVDVHVHRKKKQEDPANYMERMGSILL
jgi:tetratricopeptide (TPR) repeat protein